MRRRVSVALLAALLGGPAAVAWAVPHGGPGVGGHGAHGAPATRGVTIDMGAAAFLPPRVDILAGDTVTWRNTSVRRHTVNAEDGTWGAGALLPGEEHAHAFPTPGTATYVCRLHPGMRGELGIHRILLDPQPLPGAPGRAFPLTGRAALPEGATVTLEADAGGGFAPAGQATIGADGRFTATIRPGAAASYRAVAGGEASPAVPVLVVDRSVRTSLRRDGGRATITTTVAPAAPGATVVLQLRLPERFGWWPVARAKLDRRSRAHFLRRPRRTVAARVVLTLADGATPVAHSRTFRLRGSGRR